MVYNTVHSQNDVESKKNTKKPLIKFGRGWIMINGISQHIKKDKYGPYAADIITLKENDLLITEEYCKSKGKSKKYSLVRNMSRCSDTHTKEENYRSTAGHWKMDTALREINSFPLYLLTLTERKTKAEITGKILDGTAATIKKVIDKIVCQIKTIPFRELFTSILPDNLLYMEPL